MGSLLMIILNYQLIISTINSRTGTFTTVQQSSKVLGSEYILQQG